MPAYQTKRAVFVVIIIRRFGIRKVVCGDCRPLSLDPLRSSIVNWTSVQAGEKIGGRRYHCHANFWKNIIASYHDQRWPYEDTRCIDLLFVALHCRVHFGLRSEPVDSI